MRKQPLLALMTTGAGLIFVLSPSFNTVKAQQNPCPLVRQPAASETRQIENQEVGFKFQIPANYRTQKEKASSDDGTILIRVRNPGDLEFFECSRKNRQIGYGHLNPSLDIYLKNAPSKIVNLRDSIYPPYSKRKILSVSMTTIANQEAVIFIDEDGPKENYINARFYSPDKRYQIEISQYVGNNGQESPLYQKEKPVFQKAISTFKFY